MYSHGDRRALIALAALAEPGGATFAQLLETHTPSEALAIATRETTDRYINASAAETYQGMGVNAFVDKILTDTEACGARIVVTGDDEWPQALDSLSSLDDPDDVHTRPPLCLWVRGPHDLAEAVTTSVSIVGARCCTPYGRTSAYQLSFGLATQQWTVVSGGAYGIDTAVHQGALEAEGVTVAVLACGVDRPYPASNMGLFHRIAEKGLLVSEWPPGAIPHRHRFLIRNRIIAALTRGTVVVEAALRSGARHTAQRAKQLGRTVMIVPGPVTSQYSAGAHALARNIPGVRLATQASDVIADLANERYPQST